MTGPLSNMTGPHGVWEYPEFRASFRCSQCSSPEQPHFRT